MDAWTVLILSHQIGCERRREAARYRLAKHAAAALRARRVDR